MKYSTASETPENCSILFTPSGRFRRRWKTNRRDRSVMTRCATKITHARVRVSESSEGSGLDPSDFQAGVTLYVSFIREKQSFESDGYVRRRTRVQNKDPGSSSATAASRQVKFRCVEVAAAICTERDPVIR